ncbi:hypothetical protein [uncultured Bradyrhizobium sp.]|uniref:hypothetical protein n=1 Tax=uncultured Bradyrhizobium sp. TaxID=199684 RepID=UPI002622C459|nr:hypothetical protein [uncultured Bradyrhizobium sp.]
MAIECLPSGSPSENHPQRKIACALATVKNVAIVLFGGAAIASPVVIGALFGSALLGALIASPLSLVAVEAVKRSAAFIALVAQLTAKLDSMSDCKVIDWFESRVRDCAPFRSFVISNEFPLREIAKSTDALAWILPYIDFVVGEKGQIPLGDPGTS